MKTHIKQAKPQSIYTLAKKAFGVSEGLDAYHLMYAYYKQITGLELPKSVGSHPKEQEALRSLLSDLVISGEGVMVREKLVKESQLVRPGYAKELSLTPSWYDFGLLRELIITFYQELDFKICHPKFKEDWIEINNGKPIPYPLWDDKEMYDNMITTLQSNIEKHGYVKPKHPVKLRKKDVKEKYGWNDKTFTKFYPQPLEVKQHKIEANGKYQAYHVTSHIYDGNVIDEIVETEEYQVFIQKKGKR
jgi:hypothetical protein